MSADRDESHSKAESNQLQQGLAFLHQARQVQRLAPVQVERIQRRLKGRSHASRRRLLLPALAALGLILVSGATFAVAKGGLHSLPIVGPLFAPPSATDAQSSDERRHPARVKSEVEQPPLTNPAISKLVLPQVAAPVAPPVQTIPMPIPSQPAPRSVRLAGTRPRTLALRPAPIPAQDRQDKAENPIVAESRSFASVIEPWHRTRNASTTLALLEAHEQRYPNGHMRLESRLLRAEIYLTQGRERDALSVLDAVSLSGIPRGRELQTVRGELRIKTGRCADGKRDLGDVLEKSVADALAKRAAQAMSRCP